MNVSKKRMMRQVIDFMWKKMLRGGITRSMLFRVQRVVDMPTPGEWRT